MQREWAVPLDTAFTNPAAPAFTSDTFNFWVWTDSALGDVPDENTVPVTIRYTLASAPSVDGDFDNDGDYDCDDVNALVGDIAAGNNTASFDLTGDGNVNGDDLTSWLSEAGEANLGPGKAYLPGDANLSGDVDGSDFGAGTPTNSRTVPLGAWATSTRMAPWMDRTSASGTAISSRRPTATYWCPSRRRSC